jgi:hypothetical protein
MHVRLVIPCFCLSSDVFSFSLWTKLGLPHLLALGLTHLHLWLAVRPHGDPPLSLHPWWIEDFGMIGMFLHSLQGIPCFMFCGCKLMFSYCLFSIFSLASWHSSIDWCHLHIGQCHHCWRHSNIFGMMSNFLLWGDCDIDGSGERRTLLQLLPNACVFPSCHKGFWVSSLTSL